MNGKQNKKRVHLYTYIYIYIYNDIFDILNNYEIVFS